ncbi:MAG: amidohydrolase [Gemmatimonadetes bacterium]|nr:amidohydrolase [Gemmatimonadota bacterium]
MHRNALATLVAFLTFAASGCAPGDSVGGDAATPADLVVTDGRVVTMDDATPEAEAVAVRDGRIVAVGSVDEIASWVGDDTEVVDAAGRLVIPGFIEGHGHFTGLGDSRMILDLTTATSWEEIVAMVEEAAASTPAGTLIRGRGWHQEKWTDTPEPNVDGVPLHDDLSAVSSEHPVYLTHASGHASFVNGLALEMAGIDDGTPDPAGGTIVRDASGRATGLLRETASGLVGNLRAGEMTDEERAERFRRQVELAGGEALAHGVTAFHDAGTGFGTVDGYRALADAGELPIRLYVMLRVSNASLAENIGDYRMEEYGGGFLTVRSIKRSIDGALGSHGAWLLEPYEDLPSSAGLNTSPVDDVEETARIAAENGFQLNVHAIGDRANREVLDLYQRAWDATGIGGSDLRWRIEHAQHLHPDDIPRFAGMGVVASMQGVHGTSDGPWVPEKLGDERARTGAYMWRDLWDSGAIVTNGTDVPVEPIDPIASYYSMVSRMMNNGEVFYPDQALDRVESLRAYTINAAYSAFQEDVMGSITPGKYGDLVILSADILTIPEEEIPSAEVDVTILGGEVAYRR